MLAEATARPPVAAEPAAPDAAPTLPEQPYRSLAFYDENDRALFTGRDADVVRFAATLDRPDTRILILHGESGTGKTSFLRAGVIPYLEEECVGYRFLRRPDGSVLIIQAAKDLVGQLAQALLDATATPLRYDDAGRASRSRSTSAGCSTRPSGRRPITPRSATALRRDAAPAGGRSWRGWRAGCRTPWSWCSTRPRRSSRWPGRPRRSPAATTPCGCSSAWSTCGPT